MKRIGFIFRTPPHGSASGREGLDVILAASNYTEDLQVFFIGDGVMQLLKAQTPETILAKDYIQGFKLLSLCDVDAIYVCHRSLAERGFTQADLLIDCQIVNETDFSDQLATCDRILGF